MEQIAVTVKNISKQFTIKKTTLYGGVTKTGTRQVLKNITFEVKKGEVLGLIGKNGSGKSTLLKILTKIMYPNEGEIIVNGKIASILELGMGFDPESTGRKNIRIKCGLYGLSNKEIDESMEKIIKFSELGDQIDDPLRTYSSGMTAKLAFSILMYVKCDILIMDEVLSVGDASFASKCNIALRQMKNNGRSIILASHNIKTIETMCDRVMWIEQGIIKEIGDPSSVCYHYESKLTDSIETILELAETGDVSSMNRAGVMYRDGITVERDLNKAEEFFIKASEMGHVDSQINLANLKLKKGNIEEARILFNNAALMDNPVAIISLINMDNNDEIKNKLICRIKEEADNGNTRSMKLLADMLYSGIVIEKNQKEAMEWYEKCSYAHNNLAQYALGIAYRDGIGVQKDIQKSIYWLTCASNHGNNKARVELANIYRKGLGIERNMSEAIHWFEEAAISGDSNAMLQLGLIYRDGLGTDIDQDLSSKWLSRYAIQGLINTEITFADIIKQSYSNEKQSEALFWYADAATRGSAKACNNIAVCYRDGIATAPDSIKAAEYFSQSSNMNDPIATYELALLYYKGNGVNRDLEKAYSLLEKSAYMGNTNAMLQLALMKKYLTNTIPVVDTKDFLTRLNEWGNTTARIELLQHNNHEDDK